MLLILSFLLNISSDNDRIPKITKTALPLGKFVFSEFSSKQVLIAISRVTLSVDLITIEMKGFDVILEVNLQRRNYSIIDYHYQRVTFKAVGGKKFSYKGRQLVDHKMHLLFGSPSHKNSEVKRA